MASIHSGKRCFINMVMVGGGMGRTHNKENTFARAADHMGFVPKEDIMELLKSVVAAQRDHGNRDVRANARMKYLVHTLGINNFTTLVESYFGKKIQPYREMKEWKYLSLWIVRGHCPHLTWLS